MTATSCCRSWLAAKKKKKKKNFSIAAVKALE